MKRTNKRGPIKNKRPGKKPRRKVVRKVATRKMEVSSTEVSRHLTTDQLITYLQLNGHAVSDKTDRRVLENLYADIVESRSAKFGA